uniref:RNA-directed RNA polymerase n=1 Tax=Rotavirus G pigeon/HK18 TaxID=1399970 RepID=U3QY89_9REOV|nr:VP1 [Rotavirus G pigeon/HK18]
MDRFLEWLSRSMIRDLSYTSLVYTNPRISRIVLEKDGKENIWQTRETVTDTPKEAINYIKKIVESEEHVEKKVEKLLRIRYHAVYVEDKSDKRELVQKLLSITIKQLGNEELDETNINLIINDAKKWRVKNASKLRPYHFNIPIKEFIRDNEFEIIDTNDRRWKSDTLQGLIPHYYHRTHTLVSSVLYAVQSRIDTYDSERKKALKWLLKKIQSKMAEGYLELERNRKWSMTIKELRETNFRMYNTKIIHASCAMISILHSKMIIPEFLCQIVAAFEEIPAKAAKVLSSPMTLYIGICQLQTKKVVSTGNANESAQTDQPNTQRVDNSQLEEWKKSLEEDPLPSSLMLKLMSQNIKTDINTFKTIFNCFSATFHVGHRIDNSQDAIQDQVTVEYTSRVNREMYDMYYYTLKNMLKDEIKNYMLEMKKQMNSDVTVPSLASLANTSNGRTIEVEFLGRKIKTTKKMLHLDNDLFTESNYAEIGKIIGQGIPMGTRNVPARQTRGIFILPWQVAAIQHTLAETMYKRAKRGAYKGAFAEAYTAKAASLTYGILAQDTSTAEKIILYTDVSQWDASQHNTEPYRSAWINAIDEAREELAMPKSLEPRVLELNVLDKMKEIQRALLNSDLIIESPGSQREPLKIRYLGVASGEKTTKIGNSFANVALIMTVLNKVAEKIPDIRVTHMRVDGDDNVVTMYTSCKIEELQKEIKDAYTQMNARVKALASWTGLEMAKRFIICGKIFERGAISIFTAERPYGTDVSTQQMTGASLYSAAVNAYRGFGESYRQFMEDVLIPPSASTKITARLRVLLSPITLHSTGPLGYEITPGGLGGRVRMHFADDVNMQLFKQLTNSVAVNVIPDEIKEYRKTPQFKKRTDLMIDALRNNVMKQAKILEDILVDKESQKTLGVPNVQTLKNRQQLDEAVKILSKPESKLENVEQFYPEEVFILVTSASYKSQPIYITIDRLYEHESEPVRKLQMQLGVRIADTKALNKPVNQLYEIVSKIAPMNISPLDILTNARKYDLKTLNGKKTFLSDLGLQGAQLKQYLGSKLLFRDLLLAKYDKLYEAPGFGATQLTTIPLNLESAERIFNVAFRLPSNYYEILMLMLLYEYVNYIFDGGQPCVWKLKDMDANENVRLSAKLMKMIDNIKLDEVLFSDYIY